MAKASQAKQGKQGKRGKVVKQKPKVRGTVLTILLVIMGLHGLIAGYFYYAYRMADASLDRPWILGLMAIHFFANVIAAVGIWYWKKWALYVYAASTILALVVGLISVGIWSVFYMVLPLAIMGWVLRTKWSYFTD
jgi:hypothetical protein